MEFPDRTSMRKRLHLFFFLLLLGAILPVSVAQESTKPNSASVKVLIREPLSKNDVILWKIKTGTTSVYLCTTSFCGGLH